MEIIKARDLYTMSKDEIWAMEDKSFTLEFEDGVLDTHTRACVFSWYLGIFHRLYPNIPLLKEHHVGNDTITSATHLNVLSKALFSVVDTYGNSVNIELLTKQAYEVTNEIYNDFIERLQSYVSTISALSFVEVLENEKIANKLEAVEPTQDSIDDLYSVIEDVLYDPNELVGNTVGRMAKSGLVSMGQIRQCVGVRGFATDIDSNIFPNPIMNNFARGITNLSESMIESRSASKALLFAAKKVSDTEYFSRELQLMTSIISRVHKGDCGTKKYVNFKVTSADLPNLVGKNYITDDGSIKEVFNNDRGLIGKTLKLRSSIKCEHPDAYGVCSTCMGRLADSIPANTNVGHMFAIVLGDMITQNLLSTKHLDGSSKVDQFVLDDFARKFLKVVEEISIYSSSDEPMTVIKLSDKLASNDAKIYMTLSSEQARNLPDVDYHELADISAPSIGKLKEIMITIDDPNGFIEPTVLPVSMGSRLSWLTIDMLSYIKTNGYTLDTRGNYVVELTNWDRSKAMFQLPLKHTDMAQYMRQVKTFVMNSKKSAKAKQATPEDFLMNFYALVTSKLSINLAHLEIIVLTSLVKSVEESDHHLPVPKYDGEMSSYKENMKRRSLGPAMAYQSQGKNLTNVGSFIYKDRPDSVYDNILYPLPTYNPKD